MLTMCVSGEGRNVVGHGLEVQLVCTPTLAALPSIELPFVKRMLGGSDDSTNSQHTQRWYPCRFRIELATLLFQNLRDLCSVQSEPPPERTGHMSRAASSNKRQRQRTQTCPNWAPRRRCGDYGQLNKWDPMHKPQASRTASWVGGERLVF